MMKRAVRENVRARGTVRTHLLYYSFYSANPFSPPPSMALIILSCYCLLPPPLTYSRREQNVCEPLPTETCLSIKTWLLIHLNNLQIYDIVCLGPFLTSLILVTKPELPV